MLAKLFEDSLPGILGCDSLNTSCEFHEIATSTDFIQLPNCSEDVLCGFAFFNVALSYPISITKTYVRTLIEDGLTELTNSDGYRDALLGGRDEELCI